MLDTPDLRQFKKYKAQYPDVVLLFRAGDIYTCYHEDARIVSRVVGSAIVARRGESGDVVMTGAPVARLESHLRQIILAGHKVALCDRVK